MTEPRVLSDSDKATDGPQGVGISGGLLILIEEMFQNQRGAPPFECQQGMERYRSAYAKHKDNMMLVMIALRGDLPTKRKILKAELWNQCNLGSNMFIIDLTQVMKVPKNCTGPKKRCNQGEKGVTDLLFSILRRYKQNALTENCT